MTILAPDQTSLGLLDIDLVHGHVMRRSVGQYVLEMSRNSFEIESIVVPNSTLTLQSLVMIGFLPISDLA